MKAVICPVCGGTGRVVASTDDGRTTALPQPQTCHGCGGIGWVSVPEDHESHLEEWLR